MCICPFVLVCSNIFNNIEICLAQYIRPYQTEKIDMKYLRQHTQNEIHRRKYLCMCKILSIGFLP